jgi:protocatechuate 3,4-dioxygenase beta subunit
MLYKAILTIYFFCILSLNAQARVVTECSITPEIWSVGSFISKYNTNNLIASNTSFVTAKGKKIIISGVLYDNNCVPIVNAQINLLQANSFGEYQLPGEEVKHFDENFLGSGTCYTDNSGRFSFVTIKPGKEIELQPNVIFTVSHNEFRTFQTRMFFPEFNNEKSIASFKQNVNDPSVLVAHEQSNANIPEYHFPITLSESNHYREY